jgi:hypothetical protein
MVPDAAFEDGVHGQALSPLEPHVRVGSGGLYLPAPQSVQTLDAIAEFLPAPQSVHVLAREAPTAVEYLPAPQSVQVSAREAPTTREYLPAPHFVQTLDAIAEYLPAPQSVQTSGTLTLHDAVKPVFCKVKSVLKVTLTKPVLDV